MRKYIRYIRFFWAVLGDQVWYEGVDPKPKWWQNRIGPITAHRVAKDIFL